MAMSGGFGGAFPPFDLGELIKRVVRALKVLFGADSDAETLGKLVAEGLREIARVQGELALAQALIGKAQVLLAMAEVQQTGALYDIARAEMLKALESHNQTAIMADMAAIEERKTRALEQIAGCLVQLLAARTTSNDAVVEALYGIAQVLRELKSDTDIALPGISILPSRLG